MTMRSLADVLGISDTDPLTGEPMDAPTVQEEEPILSGEEFCRQLVESREYRESIKRRILMDELPPAIECRLLDHAWGKPTERVEVKDTTDPYEHASAKELEAEAERLLATIHALRQNDEDGEDALATIN